VVPLDWWPVSRDCLAYGVTVAILICIIHDERVEWYEALTLVLLYIVYIAVMYYDKSFQRCARFRRKNSARTEDLNARPTGETFKASWLLRHDEQGPSFDNLPHSHDFLHSQIFLKSAFPSLPPSFSFNTPPPLIQIP
jgi:Ca2+/Na+ antiporter